ncbi:MAG: hypothetical protein JWM33_2841, partial [Caulobacteraceae bacterium]|nr:hypothetical protein [Caulobacteraceae bacterium]
MPTRPFAPMRQALGGLLAASLLAGPVLAQAAEP